MRNNAAFALGEVDATEAVPHLIALMDDPEEWVRKSAAKALGMLKAVQAVTALDLATNDPSSVVRKNAIRSLGKIGGDAAMLALKRIAAGRENGVAQLAREALEKLKPASH